MTVKLNRSCIWSCLERRNEKDLSFSLQHAEYHYLLSSWRGQVLVEMQILCNVFTICPSE